MQLLDLVERRVVTGNGLIVFPDQLVQCRPGVLSLNGVRKGRRRRLFRTADLVR